jgi:hypothetical protein
VKHSKSSAWFNTIMFFICAAGFAKGYMHRDAVDMLWYGFISAVWFRCAETAWERIRGTK